MLIEWQESLKVGYEPIDRDHEKLVALINTLFDDIQAGCSRATLEDALFALADEVAAHFNHENTLMLIHHYPEQTTHLLEHRKLIDRLDTELDRIDLIDTDTLLQAIGFIDDWFVRHVVDSDARLAAFLAGQAARRRA